MAWSCSLGVTVLLDPLSSSGPVRAPAGLTTFGAASLASWRVTRVLVRLLRRLHPDEPGPSWPDFVGLTCTVRSERADDGFGRAEVVARDGSTAVVRVRRRGTHGLVREGTETLCAYDEADGFFWVGLRNEPGSLVDTEFPVSWSRLMFRPFTRRTAVRLLTAASVLLTLSGAVMWVLPGPGLPVLLLGMLCLAAAGAVRLIGRSR